MIFDHVNRTDASPKLSVESDFSFLNRSSRVEMANARQLLEQLAANYPEPDDLANRFRSGNNHHFRSAEFELILFSALTARGFSLTPHPTLENGSRPDFLVTTPSGEGFYLEAVLASEDTEDRTNDPLLATTLDVFSKASHLNFGVIVSTSGYPSTQPSSKKLLRRTLEWLDSLDPDEVQAQIDESGHRVMPVLVWTHEHLEIEIQALPLRPDRRGKASRLLVAQFGQAGWIDAWSPIKDAIRFKGSKYGKLEKPLVIAVNYHGHHLDRDDEMQALFGQDQIILSTVNPDAEPRYGRAPNGAWRGKGGPEFTRVSGAWIFSNLCIYNIPSREATLYLHPWAQHAVPEDMLQFSHAIGGVNDQMTWRKGVSMGDILGLPEGWPGGSNNH